MQNSPAGPPEPLPSSCSLPASTAGGAQRPTRFPVCPACGGELVEIRMKLQCTRCHTICETCCEGGRG
ncbi:MAG: hypothetical protein U0903_06795 [Planctomycetales bacterium]